MVFEINCAYVGAARIVWAQLIIKDRQPVKPVVIVPFLYGG
jgi:hypothetical protein